MYQFEFHNPVRVFFGKDELCHLPTVIKQYGGKVLVLYSDSFRRNSSYYDEIINILNSEDVETIECCGIMANPRAYVVDRIAQLCRKSKIKLLLAMGGGSVMDCAKAVSAIACTEETCGDLLNREVRIENVLPVVTIPTTLSTGSEMNCGGLISIPEKKQKSVLVIPYCIRKLPLLFQSLLTHRILNIHWLVVQTLFFILWRIRILLEAPRCR